MASQRGRARVAEKPRGGFVFGSSTPRELSYVRSGAPSGTRSADASSSGSPSAGGEKQHSLSYYMRQARSITPSCSDRNKGWAFGSSTPRQFSHLGSIKPELRVYDVKIQTKSARSHTAPSINDRPPKAPSAAPKPRPPVQKSPKNEDAESVSSEPDFREHREPFKKQPNGTTATKTSKVTTTTTTVRKTSSSVKTPSKTTTTTVKKVSSTSSTPKKTPAAPAPSPVAKKVSTPEAIPAPGKRKASGVEHFAPGLPLAAEQEHMVPKAVHTGHEEFQAISSVPSVTTHNDTSEVMQEDSNIEELVEQKHIAQSEAGNVGGVATNVADKISEVLHLASQQGADVEEPCEQRVVKKEEPAPEKKEGLFGGIGAFISSAQEKIRDVVQEAESHGIDVGGLAEKGVEALQEKMRPAEAEEECVQKEHEFGGTRKAEEKPAAENPAEKSLLDSASELLGGDVVEKAIGFVQNLKQEPTAPAGAEVVDEEECVQQIVAPHTGVVPASEKPEAGAEKDLLGDTIEPKKEESKKVVEPFPTSFDPSTASLLERSKEVTEVVLSGKDTVAEHIEKPTDAQVTESAFQKFDETVRQANEDLHHVAQETSKKAEEAEKHVDTVSHGVKDIVDESSKKLAEFGDSVKDTVASAAEESSKKASEGLGHVGDTVASASESAKQAVEQVSEDIVSLGETVKDTVSSGVGETKDAFFSATHEASDLASSAKDTVAKGAHDLAETSVDFAKSTKDTVADAFSTGFEKAEGVVEGAKEAGAEAASSLKDGAEKATDTVATGAETVVDSFKKGVEDTGKAVDTVGDTVAQAAKDARDTVVLGAEKAADTVAHGAEKTKDTVFSGVDIVIEGAKDAAHTVADGAEKAADTVIQGTKDASDTVVLGASKVADTVTHGAEKTKDTVFHGAESAADTVIQGTKDAADTIAYGAGKVADSVSHGAETAKDTVILGADTVAQSAKDTFAETATGAQQLLGGVKEKVAETAKASEKATSSFGSKLSSFFSGKD